MHVAIQLNDLQRQAETVMEMITAGSKWYKRLPPQTNSVTAFVVEKKIRYCLHSYNTHPPALDAIAVTKLWRAHVDCTNIFGKGVSVWLGETISRKFSEHE